MQNISGNESTSPPCVCICSKSSILILPKEEKGRERISKKREYADEFSTDVIFRSREPSLSRRMGGWSDASSTATRLEDKEEEVQRLSLWIDEEAGGGGDYEEIFLDSLEEEQDREESIYETISPSCVLIGDKESEALGSGYELYSFSDMLLACKNRFSRRWNVRKGIVVYGARLPRPNSGMRQLKKQFTQRKKNIFGSFYKKSVSNPFVPSESDSVFYVNTNASPSSEDSLKVKPRRRSSSSKSAIVRPKEAPPEPPVGIPEIKTNDSEPMEDVYCSYLFASEPLYHQFYEEITFPKKRISTMELMERPLKRTLWSDLNEVQEKNFLQGLGREEICHQEALFEVITSEASYLKSLNVFISVFMSSRELTSLLDKREASVLFSDILSIRVLSEKLFFELDAVWQRSLFLEGLLGVLEGFARRDLKAYVKYTTNQVYQDRLLFEKLKDKAFREVVRGLEGSLLCESLSFHSFLLLPMQRITRYPLLLSAIIKYIPSNKEEDLRIANSTLKIMNELVRKCNDSARHMERMEEMLKYSSCFDFNDLRSIPLLSPGRWLLQRTHVLRLDGGQLVDASGTPRGPGTLSNKLKLNKQHLHLFLFTDLLVIVKQKSETHYKVLDHCPRNLICMSEDGLPSWGATKGSSKSPSYHASWLSLLQNHEGRTVELLIAFDSPSEQSTWSSLLLSNSAAGSDDVIYEPWDCPLVVAKDDIPQEDEDDEEDAAGGGTTQILLPKGEKGRIRQRRCNPSGSISLLIERMDESGGSVWVAPSAVEEISSDHVMAKHLRQRHKFLKLIASHPISSST